MKYLFKIILTTILIVNLLPSVSNAQENNVTRFGLKGGVNFSNLYGKDDDKTTILTGFNVGLFGKLPIAGLISIQPEIYFITKGAEVTYDNTFVDGIARFKLNYVEVPLLLVANLTPNVNIHVGPYVAFLISGKVTNESNVNIFDFDEALDKDDYNTLDAGLAVGAGLDFKAVSLGVRYNHGLTKVGKERDFFGTSYTFPDATNGVISLYIALGLN